MRRQQRHPPGRSRFAHAVLAVFVSLVVMFSLAPLVFIVISSFSAATVLEFPPSSISIRWYSELARASSILAALRNSAILASVVVLCVLVLSLMATYVLRAMRGKLRTAIELLFQSPLLLPQIVLGFALLQVFVAAGFGQTFTEMLIAHVVITFPYGFRALDAALKNFDFGQEEAALTLGSSRLGAIMSVLVPQLAPALLAAGTFVFILSFDNVTVSLWLIGPGFDVLPMWFLSYVQNSTDPLPTAVATVTLVLSAIVVAILERTLGGRGSTLLR